MLRPAALLLITKSCSYGVYTERVCGVRTSHSCPEYDDCSILLRAFYAADLCISRSTTHQWSLLILNAMLDLATTTCVEKIFPKRPRQNAGLRRLTHSSSALRSARDTTLAASAPHARSSSTTRLSAWPRARSASFISCSEWC